MKKTRYVAYFQPTLQEGQQDPSRGGFKTRDEAERYIISQQCKGCQNDIKNARFGSHDPMLTGCAAEWSIIPQSKFTKTTRRVKGVGWKEIYQTSEYKDKRQKISIKEKKHGKEKARKKGKRGEALRKQERNRFKNSQ